MPKDTAPAADEITGGGFQRIPFDTIPGRKIFEQQFKGSAGLDAQDEFFIHHWKQAALGGQSAGALFVSVEGEALPEWDGKKKRFGAQALVQVTDLGLAWKLTPDQAFLFVFSEAGGQPLGGSEADPHSTMRTSRWPRRRPPPMERCVCRERGRPG